MEVNQKSILYLIANEFGLNRKGMEQRLRLQKTIYLLIADGMQLGYGFGWYKYGPYSQDLVYDAYAVLGAEKEAYKEGTEGWKFSEKSKEKIEAFKEKFKDVLDNPAKLELLASVDFIFSTWCEQKIEQSAFVEKFKKYKRRLYNEKKDISDEKIKEALERCIKEFHNN